MASEGNSETQRILTALAHPLRRKILRGMGDGEPVSSCRMAKNLDEQLASVGYHTQVLADCGTLELDELRPVLGTNRRRYRRAPMPEWARVLLGESSS